MSFIWLPPPRKIPRAFATIFATSPCLHASSRVSMIGMTTSPAPGRLEVSLPMLRASADIAVMPTLFQLSDRRHCDALASLTNAPSASPDAVHAPPISTSVPARIIGGTDSVSFESNEARMGMGFARGVLGVIVKPVRGLRLQTLRAAEAREVCMRRVHPQPARRWAHRHEWDPDRLSFRATRR